MRFAHHDLEGEIPDAWWREADMTDFVPKTKCYRAKPSDKGESFEVAIVNVAPLHERKPPLFRDDKEKGICARERVVKILRGFVLDEAIPPVGVWEAQGGEHPYKLTHGAHRFYCSVAAGFTHVPAVKRPGWDQVLRVID